MAFLLLLPFLLLFFAAAVVQGQDQRFQQLRHKSSSVVPKPASLPGETFHTLAKGLNNTFFVVGPGKHAGGCLYAYHVAECDAAAPFPTMCQPLLSLGAKGNYFNGIGADSVDVLSAAVSPVTNKLVVGGMFVNSHANVTVNGLAFYVPPSEAVDFGFKPLVSTSTGVAGVSGILGSFSVDALAFFSDGTLIAGGFFQRAGNIPSPHLALYDFRQKEFLPVKSQPSCSALTGENAGRNLPGLNDAVTALATYSEAGDEQLFVAGSFSSTSNGLLVLPGIVRFSRRSLCFHKLHGFPALRPWPDTLTAGIFSLLPLPNPTPEHPTLGFQLFAAGEFYSDGGGGLLYRGMLRYVPQTLATLETGTAFPVVNTAGTSGPGCTSTDPSRTTAVRSLTAVRLSSSGSLETDGADAIAVGGSFDMCDSSLIFRHNNLAFLDLQTLAFKRIKGSNPDGSMGDHGVQGISDWPSENEGLPNEAAVRSTIMINRTIFVAGDFDHLAGGIQAVGFGAFTDVALSSNEVTGKVLVPGVPEDGIGLNGEVHAFIEDPQGITGPLTNPPALVVAGEFHIAGRVTASNLVRYTDAKGFEPVQGSSRSFNGIASSDWPFSNANVSFSFSDAATVYSLALFSGRLYAGGRFSANRQVEGMCCLALHTDAGFSDLGANIGMLSTLGPATEVRALAVHSPSALLFIGGNFAEVRISKAATISVSNIVAFNGGSFSALPAAFTGGSVYGLHSFLLSSSVTALAIVGAFTQPFGSIAIYSAFDMTEAVFGRAVPLSSGPTVQALYDPAAGENGAGIIRAALYNPSLGALIVGGSLFRCAQRLRYICAYTFGSDQQAPGFKAFEGTDIAGTGLFTGVSSEVYSLAALGNDIIITGLFSQTQRPPLTQSNSSLPYLPPLVLNGALIVEGATKKFKPLLWNPPESVVSSGSFNASTAEVGFFNPERMRVIPQTRNIFPTVNAALAIRDGRVAFGGAFGMGNEATVLSGAALFNASSVLAAAIPSFTPTPTPSPSLAPSPSAQPVFSSGLSFLTHAGAAFGLNASNWRVASSFFTGSRSSDPFVTGGIAILSTTTSTNPASAATDEEGGAFLAPPLDLRGSFALQVVLSFQPISSNPSKPAHFGGVTVILSRGAINKLKNSKTSSARTLIPDYGYFSSPSLSSPSVGVGFPFATGGVDPSDYVPDLAATPGDTFASSGPRTVTPGRSRVIRVAVNSTAEVAFSPDAPPVSRGLTAAVPVFLSLRYEANSRTLHYSMRVGNDPSSFLINSTVISSATAEQVFTSMSKLSIVAKRNGDPSNFATVIVQRVSFESSFAASDPGTVSRLAPCISNQGVGYGTPLQSVISLCQRRRVTLAEARTFLAGRGARLAELDTEEKVAFVNDQFLVPCFDAAGSRGALLGGSGAASFAGPWIGAKRAATKGASMATAWLWPQSLRPVDVFSWASSSLDSLFASSEEAPFSPPAGWGAYLRITSSSSTAGSISENGGLLTNYALDALPADERLFYLAEVPVSSEIVFGPDPCMPPVVTVATALNFSSEVAASSAEPGIATGLNPADIAPGPISGDHFVPAWSSARPSSGARNVSSLTLLPPTTAIDDPVFVDTTRGALFWKGRVNVSVAWRAEVEVLVETDGPPSCVSAPASSCSFGGFTLVLARPPRNAAEEGVLGSKVTPQTRFIDPAALTSGDDNLGFFSAGADTFPNSFGVGVALAPADATSAFVQHQIGTSSQIFDQAVMFGDATEALVPGPTLSSAAEKNLFKLTVVWQPPSASNGNRASLTYEISNDVLPGVVFKRGGPVSSSAFWPTTAVGTGTALIGVVASGSKSAGGFFASTLRRLSFVTNDPSAPSPSASALPSSTPSGSSSQSPTSSLLPPSVSISSSATPSTLPSELPSSAATPSASSSSSASSSPSVSFPLPSPAATPSAGLDAASLAVFGTPNSRLKLRPHDVAAPLASFPTAPFALAHLPSSSDFWLAEEVGGRVFYLPSPATTNSSGHQPVLLTNVTDFASLSFSGGRCALLFATRGSLVSSLPQSSVGGQCRGSLSGSSGGDLLRIADLRGPSGSSRVVGIYSQGCVPRHFADDGFFLVTTRSGLVIETSTSLFAGTNNSVTWRPAEATLIVVASAFWSPTHQGACIDNASFRQNVPTVEANYINSRVFLVTSAGSLLVLLGAKNASGATFQRELAEPPIDLKARGVFTADLAAGEVLLAFSPPSTLLLADVRANHLWALTAGTDGTLGTGKAVTLVDPSFLAAQQQQSGRRLQQAGQPFASSLVFDEQSRQLIIAGDGGIFVLEGTGEKTAIPAWSPASTSPSPSSATASTGPLDAPPAPPASDSQALAASSVGIAAGVIVAIILVPLALLGALLGWYYLKALKRRQKQDQERLLKEQAARRLVDLESAGAAESSTALVDSLSLLSAASSTAAAASSSATQELSTAVVASSVASEFVALIAAASVGSDTASADPSEEEGEAHDEERSKQLFFKSLRQVLPPSALESAVRDSIIAATLALKDLDGLLELAAKASEADREGGDDAAAPHAASTVHRALIESAVDKLMATLSLEPEEGEGSASTPAALATLADLSTQLLASCYRMAAMGEQHVPASRLLDAPPAAATTKANSDTAALDFVKVRILDRVAASKALEEEEEPTPLLIEKGEEGGFDGAATSLTRKASRKLAASTSTAAAPSSASFAVSSVKIDMAGKKQKGAAAQVKEAGVSKTATLTKEQQTRRALEALVVLSLESAAKKAASVVVEAAPPPPALTKQELKKNEDEERKAEELLGKLVASSERLQQQLSLRGTERRVAFAPTQARILSGSRRTLVPTATPVKKKEDVTSFNPLHRGGGAQGNDSTGNVDTDLELLIGRRFAQAAKTQADAARDAKTQAWQEAKQRVLDLITCGRLSAQAQALSESKGRIFVAPPPPKPKVPAAVAIAAAATREASAKTGRDVLKAPLRQGSIRLVNSPLAELRHGLEASSAALVPSGQGGKKGEDENEKRKRLSLLTKSFGASDAATVLIKRPVVALSQEAKEECWDDEDEEQALSSSAFVNPMLTPEEPPAAAQEDTRIRQTTIRLSIKEERGDFANDWLFAGSSSISRLSQARRGSVLSSAVPSPAASSAPRGSFGSSFAPVTTRK